MNTERASQILRTLTNLRSQVELSLSFQQRHPRTLHFHRQLDSVISDIKQLTYQSPVTIRRALKPRAENAEPPQGDPNSQDLPM